MEETILELTDLQDKYVIHEEFHGISILKNEFPEEYNHLYEVLNDFQLYRSEVVPPGGGKSLVSNRIDNDFYNRGFEEKQFQIQIIIDGVPNDTPTHKIDYFKNRVGIELEWNNKTEFYDRDLNNFRLLHSIKALSVGVIITRCSELQEIFNELGKGSSYGASTTHLNKLMGKIHGGGHGTCPLIVIGIKPECYVED